MKLVIGGIGAVWPDHRGRHTTILPAGGGGDFTALACQVGRHQGEELTHLSIDIGLRNSECGPRGLDIRVVMKRAIDEVIERWRVKKLPPFGGKFVIDVEMLRLVLRRKGLGFLPGGVARDIRRLWGMKIRSNAGVKAKRPAHCYCEPEFPH